MIDGKLSVVCFGAHPDDCDLRFAGMAMLYRAHGQHVRLVSLTNGDAGHFDQGGGPLARRRYAEAQAAAAVAGVEYEVWDIHDGELEPTTALRGAVIRTMREARADIVLCHRPNDYHPDHRAVGVLVQDAAYTVTVPNIAPLTPHLDRPPVVGYLYDEFEIPNPYVPTIAIDTDPVFDCKVDMVACHRSQFYEWLPYNAGALDGVPDDEADRKAWLARRLTARFARAADRSRALLKTVYGEGHGGQVATAETIMLSEYGRRLQSSEADRLFPFLPRGRAARCL